MKPADVRNLTLASLGLLITGLVLPCMTFHRLLGPLSGWVNILAPDALASTMMLLPPLPVTEVLNEINSGRYITSETPPSI